VHDQQQRGLAMSSNDLVWDLDAFRARKRAAEFVKSFENKLCVFNGSVNQLYTSYRIDFPSHDPRTLLIMPKPFQPHDTYNNVPESSVMPTRIQIIRSQSNSNDNEFEPLLRIPYKAGKRTHHIVPLRQGLEIVRGLFPVDDPFLPVLVKGDLREMRESSTPYIQLHRIKIHELRQMSMFESAGIKHIIMRKLARINK
jgi:hypothetical protein